MQEDKKPKVRFSSNDVSEQSVSHVPLTERIRQRGLIKRLCYLQ